METRYLLPLCVVTAFALTCAVLPPAVAADPAPVQRAEHVRAMEERAQLRGLQVIDYSRLKTAP